MRSRVYPAVLAQGSFWSLVLLITACISVGYARELQVLGSNYLDIPTIQSTMNFENCQQYQVGKKIKICIVMGRGSFQCNDKPPIRCIPSYDHTFNYWEPSELIEVSCRKGFSLLKGSVGEEPQNQSCVGSALGSGGKAQRWFFDARVWAINGGSGGAREQAGGSERKEQSRKCGLNDPLIRKEGYATKFDMFSRGGGSGPGGSWEAYISDYDPSWAKDTGAGPGPNTATETACSGINIDNCWGRITPLTGWVLHPHQPVAAALAGWRAHTKAQGKVSPDNGNGYKIDMDYPYILRASPYAQSMNVTGTIGGRHRGSACFQPGDPGPWWFTNGQTQILPEQIPQYINSLKDGDTSKVGDLHPGVFIFTVWVRTGCELFKGIDMSNVQNAINDCKDKQDY